MNLNTKKILLTIYTLLICNYNYILPTNASNFNQDISKNIAIYENLRCPICEAQSIAESNNSISAKMREEVDRLLNEGKNEKEIYNYFSSRYGDFVLMNPPKKGINLFLWLSPIIIFVIGGLVLNKVIKTSKNTNKQDDLYLKRVKEETK